MVRISEPMVNVVAVRFARFTVDPAVMFIISSDIPGTVSVKTIVSPSN